MVHELVLSDVDMGGFLRQFEKHDSTKNNYGWNLMWTQKSNWLGFMNQPKISNHL
jgi:hypothetical protein